MTIRQTEAQFKAAYISQFLATYMAHRYEADCMSGHAGEPYKHQPIEDAAFLANEAWNQISEFVENSAPHAHTLCGVFAIPAK
ncbi:DNA methyltransferase [Novimethylophilus kurashikiensis]|uniref:DNA methyltransferase n=1 Tax=Novimethylophilus kurashikiensis TaxID=1825523 RepID=A0A2R5FD02_9PROT|nr:hypothetical protein [Novimethylophilus kurashikiensis]GBG14514.1 DNA methyltransferase [Novimethylophilus kurashikiensis]